MFVLKSNFVCTIDFFSSISSLALILEKLFNVSANFLPIILNFFFRSKSETSWARNSSAAFACTMESSARTARNRRTSSSSPETPSRQSRSPQPSSSSRPPSRTRISESSSTVSTSQRRPQWRSATTNFTNNIILVKCFCQLAWLYEKYT